MPTYEYSCRKCGRSFTLVMRMSKHENMKVKCPRCSSAQVVQRVQEFFATTSKKS